jgi:hypothetical protein
LNNWKVNFTQGAGPIQWSSSDSGRLNRPRPHLAASRPCPCSKKTCNPAPDSVHVGPHHRRQWGRPVCGPSEHPMSPPPMKGAPWRREAFLFPLLPPLQDLFSRCRSTPLSRSSSPPLVDSFYLENPLELTVLLPLFLQLKLYPPPPRPLHHISPTTAATCW